MTTLGFTVCLSYRSLPFFLCLNIVNVQCQVFPPRSQALFLEIISFLWHRTRSMSYFMEDWRTVDLLHMAVLIKKCRLDLFTVIYWSGFGDMSALCNNNICQGLWDLSSHDKSCFAVVLCVHKVSVSFCKRCASPTIKAYCLHIKDN